MIRSSVILARMSRGVTWIALAFLALVIVAASMRSSRIRVDQRPAALDEVGIRLGGEWLTASPFHGDLQLGTITQIVARRSGELAILGTEAAAFLQVDGSQRLVTFRPRSRETELVETLGQPRYVDRGGGGWQTGAFIGEDGARLWRPDSMHGMDDLAAGDVDGDGVPEVAVGYNGDGGIHLHDAAGELRWREDDANVWHVEVVDTDGDGRSEVVHSNAGGQLTIRDASGKVRRRKAMEGYLSQFSVLAWPPEQSGLLYAGDGVTRVVDFEGRTRVRLSTPDSNFLMAAHGAPVRFGTDDFLVVTLSMDNWDRTQLFVFDRDGTLRYREVVSGVCNAVAAPEPDAFLFGCGPSVRRYALR